MRESNTFNRNGILAMNKQYITFFKIQSHNFTIFYELIFLEYNTC